jgi:gluconate kinase
MVEFAYNNIMHSSTQQTPFFANHGLHPKFDIQSVHKVVNLTTEDGAMWLANVQTQLVFNLEETQGQYKENVDEHHKEQLSFKVED